VEILWLNQVEQSSPAISGRPPRYSCSRPPSLMISFTVGSIRRRSPVLIWKRVLSISRGCTCRGGGQMQAKAAHMHVTCWSICSTAGESPGILSLKAKQCAGAQPARVCNFSTDPTYTDALYYTGDSPTYKDIVLSARCRRCQLLEFCRFHLFAT
jgi:hypothetical protein